MEKPYPPVNYAEYLRVKDIISLQHPKSVEYGKPAHDEMLFIIIHQAYELWFKQVLFEIDSVLELFSSPNIPERNMLKMVSRLHRVIEIQKLLLQQVDVLETMTPMDFLEFGEFLVPASGFQSHQFRLIENKLGLKLFKVQQPRLQNIAHRPGKTHCSKRKPRLPVHLFGKLAGTTPFIFSNAFNFWDLYKQAVQTMFDENAAAIRASNMDDEQKESPGKPAGGARKLRRDFRRVQLRPASGAKPMALEL